MRETVRSRIQKAGICLIWVFELDEDLSGKPKVWAEMGFKVRFGFIMGVGIEGRPRLGKGAGF